MCKIEMDSCTYVVNAEAKNALRLRAEHAKQGGLDRYGMYSSLEEASLPEFRLVAEETVKEGLKGHSLVLQSEAGEDLTTVRMEQLQGGGYRIHFSLKEGEQFYGLGDVSRNCLDRRGGTYRMWVVNVNSYAPIPFIMSNRGWALLVNTTYEHFWDVGDQKKDELCVFSKYGTPDITLFTGKDYGELLKNYTALTGRPQMLPRWAFGLTFVCHTMANVNDMLSDALNFRREDMPCDVIGLEPGWMEKHYDQTTEKKWHPERFPVPFYAPKGPHTFCGALERLGFKLSLWLCCDYDLTWYEEAQLGNPLSEQMTIKKDNHAYSFEQDTHFQVSGQRIQEAKKLEEGWFEHLKKFTDQGASCYKLDGSYQVNEHPDRRWGNGMYDEEAHNLYPVIYAKQMSQGFSDFTGKRSMIYSSGGYTGVQRYAATWAGDTGGGFEPMVSILNHGFSGHSNTSCDMEIFSLEGIHFGFLQPWSQLNSWNYFRHPWLLEDENKEVFREYDKLRYSLFPYLYTAAHQAYETGMPMMRALPLVYSADPQVHELLNEYMLGDSLLVGSFLEKAERQHDGRTVNMYLPEGDWYDWFSGAYYEGGQWIFYEVPQGKGGALFVKAGSAVPMIESGKNIGEKPFDKYIVRVWTDQKGSALGLLYEDDGVSFGYQKGEYRITKLSFREGELHTEAQGTYPGMPVVEFTNSRSI